MERPWHAALFIAAATASAGAAAEPAPGAGARYETCLAQIEIDARAALAAAEAWGAAGGGVPAGHCEVLALIALDRFEEAGRLLLALGHAAGDLDGVMRADLLGQAGNAFLLAEKAENARQAFDLALSQVPGDPDHLLDRARAKAMLADWRGAIADLDAVIAIAPNAPGPYVLRAAAKRQLKDFTGARTDIDLALLRDPQSLDALLERGLLRAAEGDRVGAQSDLEAVLAKAPATGAGRIARAALEDLRSE